MGARWGVGVSVAACAVAGGLTACATAPPTNGPLRVVTAENVWGSIAAQLGGDRVSVTSIISSPATDPHDYEPGARDARAVAMARYVIVNGAGYDPWASKLVAADGDEGQRRLNVGDAVGVKQGGNPHPWYSPDDVATVVDRITADFKALSPSDAAYFDQRRAAFLADGLSRYRSLIADIRQRFAGTPIGASESIVVPLAQALGLRVLTPESFLNAVSEGTDPTAQDKATVDGQIRSRQVKVYVFNSQNTTPDVKAQVKLAGDAGIPVASVTETLSPASASFQDWQSGQLEKLAEALATARAA